MNKIQHNELIDLSKDYCNTFCALYRLNTQDEAEIDKIYKQIKIKLIDTKMFLPSQILEVICNVAKLNNRYMKSYWELFRKTAENYKIQQIFSSTYNQSKYKTYESYLKERYIKYFIWDEIYFEKEEKTNDKNKNINYSLDIHESNPICRSLVLDDLGSFIFYTEQDGFDKYQRVKSNFYPYSLLGYSLLELCCYYGAIRCFKFLRTKFNSEITEKCLQFSFLSGVPDIMNECLKFQRPYKECMECAIISHNIDFVSFLMNEYHLKIDLEDCCRYHNLQVYLMYLDITKDINNCFVLSPSFHFPELCKYLISHGANVNAIGHSSKTHLCYSAVNSSRETVDYITTYGVNFVRDYNYEWFAIMDAAWNNSAEIAEILISHGARIDSHGINEKTACHIAIERNSIETIKVFVAHKDLINDSTLHLALIYDKEEIAKFLILNGININTHDNNGKTPLHIVADGNKTEMAELLISHGANINLTDKNDETALHYALKYDRKEMTELLISHGVNIDAKDKDGKTALHIAAERNNKEIAEFLISHGANLEETDNEGKSALDYAIRYDRKEIEKLLISYGANINAQVINGESAAITNRTNNEGKTFSQYYHNFINYTFSNCIII
ncbi:ankyrin repeat protein, putative [Trichomonas vaginalis G3]|uniref:Ankyrin repeat protein, putative n=1 Tax=Trichomonas vaginalis (strain ATCC PRA-98 / G3) TaxID=412133 RepID=A2FYR2_TRIV3|nr:spectrin binding [Trichomonas vaginalis G3]EAX89958.1 ankyrin repeat protein, putative [Trichomonas vaginalis G3]KAI5523681.1 spectrin binding [Trichomonas vaginalis G3]|eukprot:XP_001302888.1 ankyrin repeat protein [Trichomonas vaginalis G3]